MLMAEFMMIFFGLKPNNTYKFDESVCRKAKQAVDCLSKYSLKRFKELQQIREFRILIVKIYAYDLDEFFSESETMEKNFKRYIKAIEDFIDTK